MRFVVGFVNGGRGVDAMRLAATLARSRGALLDVVVVLPTNEATLDLYSPDRAYQLERSRQAQEWLDRAVELVPDGVELRTHVRRAGSIAEGLIEAATDPELGEEAGLIVIGAANRGIIGRFTAGSAATALLHSSPVPVALAPVGHEGQPTVSRVTCAVGARQGADAAVDVAVEMAQVRGVPLRLMSLVALDLDDSIGERASTLAADHIEEIRQRAAQALPAGQVSTVLGHGSSLEECVEQLDFLPDEIVLVGSSRLADSRRLFLGASASKMLRALPVPMVVVPRDYPPQA